MPSLPRLFKNTMELPFVIRTLCQGGMVVFPLLALSLLIPFSNWVVNEREVSYHELWSCGAGLALLILAGLGTFGCWGMAAHIPRARWALVLTPSAPLLALALYPGSWFTQEVLADANVSLHALIASVITYICLFHLPGLHSYFKQAGQTA